MGHRGIIKMKVNGGRENLSKTSTPGHRARGTQGRVGPPHTQPLCSWAAFTANGQREYWKILTCMKNQKQSFFKKVCNLKPPDSVSSWRFWCPLQFTAGGWDRSARQCILEVLSGLVSSGTLHINDKRRKRREENTYILSTSGNR